MIRSMTGFGFAKREDAGIRVEVEAKSINGRFLKISLRLPPSLSAYETEIEGLVRSRLRRGSISLKIDIFHLNGEAAVRVNEEIIKAYQAIFRRLGVSEEPIATLPGVLVSARDDLNQEALAVVYATINETIDNLVSMRKREGDVLAKALQSFCDNIEVLRKQIKWRVPLVLQEYHDKLKNRVNQLLSGSNISLDNQTLARELAFFADRCDINEELDRLNSHISQVKEQINKNDESGRVLDFLSQEILREVNTIGAKSSDIEINMAVVKLKTEIERFKEQIANVE
ncbi:MAG: YicC family protein [Deltaproteobacteria bacterium]|nr:YicC family protein [Deltaproteobacteria bacterium]